MAYEIPGFAWSRPANADYSGATTVKNRGVAINSSGNAIPCATNYTGIVGVAQNKPVAGEATTIISSGIVAVDAAGVNDAGSPASVALAPGDEVTVRASDAKFVKAVTTGSQVVGRIIEGIVSSGGTGQVTVLLNIGSDLL